MVITTILLALLSSPVAQAFQATPFLPKQGAAASSALYSTKTAQAAKILKVAGGVAGELGLPCEDECALVSYPKLPSSVHPGVLSGQAMMDLLNDARVKGTSRVRIFFFERVYISCAMDNLLLPTAIVFIAMPRMRLFLEITAGRRWCDNLHPHGRIFFRSVLCLLTEVKISFDI